MDTHYYLTVSMLIWPDNPNDAERIKKLLDEGATNLLQNGDILTATGDRLGEIKHCRSSIWPKDLGRHMT